MLKTHTLLHLDLIAHTKSNYYKGDLCSDEEHQDCCHYSSTQTPLLFLCCVFVILCGFYYCLSLCNAAVTG